MRRLAMALAAGAVLAGCATAPRLVAQPLPDGDWRKLATTQDRARLRGWRTAWLAAAALSERTGAGAVLASEPALFDPDRALAGAALPPGTYRCRVVKLGGRDPAAPAVLARGWAACRVGHDGRAATFAIDGAERISGHLFDDTDARGVFLGTLAVGDETRPMRYGRDARRDMAGLIERIGARRWRLVLPYPGFASTLDVIEIVPAD